MGPENTFFKIKFEYPIKYKQECASHKFQNVSGN